MNVSSACRNPFDEFGGQLGELGGRLGDEPDRHFLSMLEALRRHDESAGNEDEWKPLVDIHETDDGYRLDVELPAVNPDDMRVELHKGVLNISGERRDIGAGNRPHLRERRCGKFWRGFHLPDDADANAIRATAKDGVVSITVGKSAASQPCAIVVEAV